MSEKRKRFARSAAATIDDSSSDSDSAPDSEQEEEEEEEQHKIEPELGQICKVYVENFMCHRKFTVDFNQHLNFITGANGSGKSAIVSAVQLCLGATAKGTGRASSLAGLIREGTRNQDAKVAVTLLNKGSDPYEQHLYGNKITVERTIHPGGSSEFKLYSEQGKLVSRERTELVKILRKFFIYVDNPCCLLTQEDSKKFASKGTEKEKYLLFLKATGLKRTWDELELVQGKITASEDQGRAGAQKLQEKKNALLNLQRDLDKLTKLDRYSQQIKDCRAKLLWLDVYDSERRWNELREQVDEMTRQQEGLAKSHEKAVAALEALGTTEQQKAMVAELEQEKVDLEAKFKAKNVEVRAAEQRHTAIESTQRDLEGDRKLLVQRKAEAQKIIRDLQQKALASSGDKKQALQQKLESIDEQAAKVKEAIATANSHKLSNENALNEAREAVTQCESDLREARSSLQQAQGELSRCSKQTSTVGLFSRHMEEIVKKLGRTTGFQGPVVGPVGKYINLTPEAEQAGYGKVVEKITSNVLKNFIVTCKKDQELLSSVINSVPGAGGAQGDRIFINVRSGGRPRYNNISVIPNATTVLDCITVDNDMVFNYLVDSTGLEGIIIAKNEKECREKYLVNRQFRDGINYAIMYDKSDAFSMCLTLRYRNGTSSSDVNTYTHRDLLTSDISSAVDQMAAQVRTEEARVRHIEQSLHALKQPLAQLQRNVTEHSNEMRTHISHTKTLNRERDNVESEMEALMQAADVDTSTHESEVAELEVEINRITDQIPLGKEQLVQSHDLVKSLAAERAKIVAEKNRVDRTIGDLTQDLEKFITNREKATMSVKSEQRRLDRMQAEIKEVQAKADDVKITTERKELVAREKSAALLQLAPGAREEMDLGGGDGQAAAPAPAAEVEAVPKAALIRDCIIWDGVSRVPLGRKETKTSLQLSIDTYTAELEKGKRNAGVAGRTKELVALKLARAEEAYRNDENALVELEEMLAELREDRESRAIVWYKQLKAQSRKVTRKFHEFMQKKGCGGKVHFDHEARTLTIAAQIDSEDANTVSTNVKNCSGGERSFITFCMLLALDHVIETPFRVMDEYDVFMDGNTRTRTLDLLKNHAMDARQKQKQFIILTPQQLADVTTSKDVKIHRLQAPDRDATASGLQQQTL